MNVGQFIQLMRDPEQLGQVHISEPQKINKQYPYFQTSKLLLAKALHKSNDASFYDVLHQASVSASDRKVLFNLINTKPVLKKSESPTLQQVQSSDQEKISDPVKEKDISLGSVPDKKETKKQEEIIHEIIF